MSDFTPHANELTDALAEFRDCLRRFASLPPSGVSNVPDSHPGTLVIFSCDDGLERTKNFQKYMSDEMKTLLERMFPGNLDAQKFALLEHFRETAHSLISTKFDTPGGRGHVPSAMEWLEVECIARLPSTPADDVERRRWERLIAMRREYLFGTAPAWTGAMAEVPEAPWKGKYHRKRGDARGRLLPIACETVIKRWLAHIDDVLGADDLGLDGTVTHLT